MKYILFLLFFLYSCKQKVNKPTDCARFKTGTFVVDGAEAPYSITRTADMQIEKNLETGLTYKLRIKWQNDCTYTLSFLESSDSSQVEAPEVTVTIVKTDGDTYHYDSYAKEGGYTVSAKMRKLK